MQRKHRSIHASIFGRQLDLPNIRLGIATIIILALSAVIPVYAARPGIQVADINPIPDASSTSQPENFVRIGGTTYFIASDARNGRELWRTDGTAAGTWIVKDINPGSTSARPLFIIAINNLLFLSANDGSNGDEI